MDVREAIAARRSMRGFLPTPVLEATLRRIATEAARAAMGGNLQPWYVDVLHGAALAEITDAMAARLEGGEVEPHDPVIYPEALADLYNARRRAVGEELYGHLGIPREDRAGRKTWFARNFALFGAPAAFFVSVDRRMGPPQWADLGMFCRT